MEALVCKQDLTVQQVNDCWNQKDELLSLMCQMCFAFGQHYVNSGWTYVAHEKCKTPIDDARTYKDGTTKQMVKLHQITYQC